MFKYNLILKYNCYSVIAILFMLLVLSRYVNLKYDLSGSAWCAGVYPPLLAAQSRVELPMRHLCPSVQDILRRI